MKNLILTIFIAFLISLAIHFLLYITFKDTLQNNTLQISTTNKIEDVKKNGFTSIKYVKIKKPEIKKPEKIKKPIKKPKKIIKKKRIKEKSKKIIKKTVRKQIKKSQIKKVPILKEIKAIQLPKIEPKVDLKKLFTIQKTKEVTPIEQLKQQKLIEEQQEVKELQQLDQLTQSYIKLYGKKYFSFSKEQKRYLKDNLGRIGKITQRYLTYPTISIRTRQSGMNIIEFFLHPNGDITDLKLTDSSYYTALDENTIDTIQLAYKDYPKPTQIVKIKIYVKYILR